MPVFSGPYPPFKTRFIYEPVSWSLCILDPLYTSIISSIKVYLLNCLHVGPLL